MNNTFGNLILKKNKEVSAIDFLFEKSYIHLKQFDIETSERQMALEQLRKLITQLQTNRLRNKIKTSSKYFTL